MDTRPFRKPIDMNFHYDPILGLQYSFCEMIIINLEVCIERPSIDLVVQALKLLNEKGLVIKNSSYQEPSSEPFQTISTNAATTFI